MAATDQAATAWNERTKQLKEASDKLRERSDAAAKTLAALGTAGLTAVGVSKFSDIYPAPPGEGWTIVAVIGGFVLMTIVMAAFTLRMLRANRPLVTDPDQREMDAGDEEKTVIAGLYSATAERNGVPSLRAYEARGKRLERIADRRGEDPSAATLRTRAERITAESEATQARAALVVSRSRMTNALKGWPSFVYAVLFVLGLIGFGVGSDRLDSKRSAEVAAYKACAEAGTAGVVKLPHICDGVTSSEDPDPVKARRDALLASYTSCVGTAVKHPPTPLATCDALKAQLEAAGK